MKLPAWYTMIDTEQVFLFNNKQPISGTIGFMFVSVEDTFVF